MDTALVCRPLAISARQSALPSALPMAGGPLAFSACEAIRRPAPGRIERSVVATAELIEKAIGESWASAPYAWELLDRLSTPRPAFAGLAMSRPQIMGVINVTPDSFSDGGDNLEPERAIAAGLAMREAGATILDVGGESTRPGADVVPAEEEMRRVMPVVRGLVKAGALVSIDSRRSVVMRAALQAGAKLVNDVTGLTGDIGSLGTVAKSGASVILMHMQGEPQTMQKAPRYDDVALDVYDWLAERIEACVAAGIARARIAVDPGIGFGKTLSHNLQLLEQLALFHGLGCPIVLGVSRKSFIGKISGESEAKQRLPGSLAAALAGLERGAQMIRVHDVAETAQAVAVWRAIVEAKPEPAQAVA